MNNTADKRAFFEEHLVPTGKVAELFIDFARARERQGFVHGIFEPLNLAAAFAANPGNEDLGQLAGALGQLRDAMISVFASTGGRRLAQVLSILAGRQAGLPHAARSKVDAALSSFERALPARVSAIYAALQYEPTKRHLWLRNQTLHETPLTRGGRINRWRTFVRHLDWTHSVGLAGGAIPSPAQIANNRFRTDVGAVAAALLWDYAFTGKASVERGQDSGPPDQLPAGICVTTVAGGKLEVRGVVDPRDFLGSKKLACAIEAAAAKGVKCEVPLPADLVAKLAMREYRASCSFLHLQAAVAEVSDWMKKQALDAEEVLRLATAWKREVEVHAVREKLRKHFNSDEQRVLAQLFAQVGASEAMAAA